MQASRTAARQNLAYRSLGTALVGFAANEAGAKTAGGVVGAISTMQALAAIAQ
jgi:hypothetical protein